jgi:hypothetical protein
LGKAGSRKPKFQLECYRRLSAFGISSSHLYVKAACNACRRCALKLSRDRVELHPRGKGFTINLSRLKLHDCRGVGMRECLTRHLKLIRSPTIDYPFEYKQPLLV